MKAYSFIKDVCKDNNIDTAHLRARSEQLLDFFIENPTAFERFINYAFDDMERVENIINILKR